MLLLTFANRKNSQNIGDQCSRRPKVRRFLVVGRNSGLLRKKGWRHGSGTFSDRI